MQYGPAAAVRLRVRSLQQAGVKNLRTTEFFQGRTVRWGLAWSFTTEGMVGGKVGGVFQGVLLLALV